MKVERFKKLGVPILILAAFIFSMGTTFNRLIPPELGTFYQLILRAFMMSGMFYIAAFVNKSIKKVHSTDWPLFIFRGLLIVIDFACVFFAVNHLQLGTTLFLFYAGSIATSYLFGYFLLHEKLDQIKIISLTLAIVGLVIIYSDGLSSVVNFYALFAITAGVCFGLQVSTGKQLTDKYSVNQVNFVAYLAAALISIPLVFLSKETISLALPFSSWLFLFVFSLIGVLAFFATLYGFKYVEVQKGSLVLLAEIPFAILIGTLFYNESTTIMTLSGGILIILALALPNIKFSKS